MHTSEEKNNVHMLLIIHNCTYNFSYTYEYYMYFFEVALAVSY